MTTEDTNTAAGGSRLERGVRRTPWFNAATERPARRGWYEVRSIGWRGADRAYWDGSHWHAWEPTMPGDGVFFLGLYVGDRWRGMLAPNVRANRPARGPQE